MSDTPRQHLVLSADSTLALDRLDELRDDDIEVADDAVVCDLEDRRVLVGVDGDDLLRVLHAGEVLHRTGDAAADHQRRTDRHARLADLPFVLAVAEVHRRARSADCAAEHRRELVEKLEVLLRPNARAAGDDDARTLQVHRRDLADDINDFRRNLDPIEMGVVFQH